MSRRRIGIAAIRADQAVDHQLQGARRLIPVHRRHDHHAVRGNEARVDLVHPVVDLTEAMVRVAGARPVTQGHRRRDTGFAGKDSTAVLGGQAAQVQYIDFDTVRFETFARELRETKGLRHLARARGVAVARSHRSGALVVSCPGCVEPARRLESRRAPRSIPARGRSWDRRTPGLPCACGGSCGCCCSHPRRRVLELLDLGAQRIGRRDRRSGRGNAS